MYKVSIIIPFHNARKYIERCLNSILKQSYTNWEVILINDGSNDGSEIICNNYIKKDTRIKLYNKSKEGVSSARNYGLNLSKGKYIMFIDIDDSIKPECLETMINIILENDNIDIVRSAFIRIYHHNNVNVTNKWKGIYNQYDIINKIIPEYIGPSDLDFPHYGTFCSVWATLYKRNTIENIKFNKNLSVMEDKVFFIEALLKAKNIYFTNRKLYNYYINPDSTLSKYQNNYIENLILTLNLITNLCKDNYIYEINKERINNLTLILWKSVCLNEIYAKLPINSSLNHIRSFQQKISPQINITFMKIIRMIKDHPTWLLILLGKYILFIKLWRKHLNISNE